mgnify:CR=1 FL=1
MSVDKKEYLRLWHLAHKEKQNAVSRAWYFSNKEKVYTYLRIWKLANKEKVSAYERKYRLANKEKRTEIWKRWVKTKNGIISRKLNRAKRRSMEGGLTFEIVQQVYEDNIKKYGTLTCCLCELSIGFGEDSLEHLIPLIRGGTNARGNLDIAHCQCNSKKNRLTFEEYQLKIRKEQ